MAASDGNTDTLRRTYEVGFWVVYFFTTATIGATSVLMEYARDERTLATYEPFLWEYSSGLCTLLLIPALVTLERRFPFSEESWRRVLPIHLFATLPFSLLHVGGMVAIRKAGYAIAGSRYDFGNVAIELFYEWRKDALTYFFILAVIYAYRFYRAGRHGKASFENTSASSIKPQRFAIKRGQDTFLVAVSDIDWIESAGNYVILHCGAANYMMRATMKSIADQLDEASFVRVHRSAIVNLERLESLMPEPSGDGNLRLKGDLTVRFSRRYREALLEKLAQAGIGV